MRWWASLVVAVACSTPSPPRDPAPVCTPVAARCDPAAEGAPILEARCTRCHAAPTRRIVEMVTSCAMPPSGMPDLERARLVGWAACR